MQTRYRKKNAGSYRENHICARQGIVFRVHRDNLDNQFVKDKFVISHFITILQGLSKIDDTLKIILKIDQGMQKSAQQKFRMKSLQNLLE